jgi:hypothetical protein
MKPPKLKAFYFDVTVTGIALVYAYSRNEALDILKDARVMVAGNKMRNPDISIAQDDGFMLVADTGEDHREE